MGHSVVRGMCEARLGDVVRAWSADLAQMRVPGAETVVRVPASLFAHLPKG